MKHVGERAGVVQRLYSLHPGYTRDEYVLFLHLKLFKMLGHTIEEHLVILLKGHLALNDILLKYMWEQYVLKEILLKETLLKEVKEH